MYKLRGKLQSQGKLEATERCVFDSTAVMLHPLKQCTVNFRFIILSDKYNLLLFAVRVDDPMSGRR